MLQPCFLREQSNDTLSSLRLAVSDPFSIFLAKLIANTLFLLVTEILMLPLFAIFYNIPILPELHYLLLVLFLGSLGISIAGTALSAISAQARMRELLLPLLLVAAAHSGSRRQRHRQRQPARPASLSCNGRASPFSASSTWFF